MISLVLYKTQEHCIVFIFKELDKDSKTEHFLWRSIAKRLHSSRPYSFPCLEILPHTSMSRGNLVLPCWESFRDKRRLFFWGLRGQSFYTQASVWLSRQCRWMLPPWASVENMRQKQQTWQNGNVGVARYINIHLGLSLVLVEQLIVCKWLPSLRSLMINVLKPHDYALTDMNKIKPSHYALSKTKSMSEELYCYFTLFCGAELACSKAAYAHGQLLDADRGFIISDVI